MSNYTILSISHYVTRNSWPPKIEMWSSQTAAARNAPGYILILIFLSFAETLILPSQRLEESSTWGRQAVLELAYKRAAVGVRCRNVWNFAQGLKFKADFHSKMSVCRHELWYWTPTLPAILTLPTRMWQTRHKSHVWLTDVKDVRDVCIELVAQLQRLSWVSDGD